MKKVILIFFGIYLSVASIAQISPSSLHTDFVLYQHRIDFDQYMRQKTIKETFELPLDSTTEYDYESACWAISQFMIKNEIVQKGFEKIYNAYAFLQNTTKRAWLEAVYGQYTTEYITQIGHLIEAETDPKLFDMMALYLNRSDASISNTILLQKLMLKRFPEYDTIPLLVELNSYFKDHSQNCQSQTPAITDIFSYQKQLHKKIIYSFQRWNRDFPGMAIIQNEDGSFAKDSAGKLIIIEQLARSASNLPYFITNGNTPQGIYGIWGTQVDPNNFIGPTPTIQMVMPYEADSLFWHNGFDSKQNALTNYLKLLPESWRSYSPVTESFYAGKIGRTEIIAHGTTIDQEYFKGKPYYPFSPTLGCLCAKEIWNISTGTPLLSEQLKLVNAFLSTEGKTGYLMVINLDNQLKPVTQEEVEMLVLNFEGN